MRRTFRAPAKVNLWLRVFRSDPTGYHPLDTLFCAIDLCDRIDIAPADTGIRLHVLGAALGVPENNLAYRAAREYYHQIGVAPSLEITLHKNIPAGAGLGGGSSDAATVLQALQELHENCLPEADVLAIAARLGSDVPFFLCGSPVAHATGRGELLTALPPLPQRSVIVLMPPFTISTSDAYAWLDANGQLMAPRTHDISARSWHDVEQVAINDFEPVLFQRYPRLRELRDALRASGSSISLVSGSGAALFGVYADAAQAEAASADFARRFGDVEIFAARTLTNETD